MNNVFLRLEGITKRYGDVEALSEVDLSLCHGEIVGVIGENGSGKTTFLRIIAGTLAPEAGKMTIGGAPYHPKSPADADKAGIVCIMNAPNLIGSLSVAENIMHDRYPKNRLGMICWRKMYAACEALLREMRIPIDPYIRASHLGVREQRVVELLRAYQSGARLVLIDEPDFAPEDEGYCPMLTLFSKITARGGTILLTTHRIRALLQIADSVAILEGGRVKHTAKSVSLNPQSVLQMLDDPKKNVYPKMRALVSGTVLRLVGLSTAQGLNDLNMEIRGGEILGICALSEHVRTRLPAALYGLDRIKRGEIRLYGQRVDIASPASAVRLGIGYLSEDRLVRGLQREFPIPENITLSNLKSVRAMGILRKRAEARIARGYVRKLNIRVHSLRDKVSTLSAGNQQKVLLARWLHADCRMLMLEEPTKNIDAPSRNQIYNLMNAYVQRGGALVILSLHVDELIGMCDRILALRDDGGYSLFQSSFNKSDILNYIS